MNAEQIYKEKGLEGLRAYLKEKYYDPNVDKRLIDYIVDCIIGNFKFKEKLSELTEENIYLTKGYLIEEGWKFNKHDDNEYWGIAWYEGYSAWYNFDSNEIEIDRKEDTIYSGKIPTIEQWKTLKELLNIK